MVVHVDDEGKEVHAAQQEEPEPAVTAAAVPAAPAPLPKPTVEETGGLVIRKRPVAAASEGEGHPQAQQQQQGTAPHKSVLGLKRAETEEEKAARAVEEMLGALRRGKQGAGGGDE